MVGLGIASVIRFDRLPYSDELTAISISAVSDLLIAFTAHCYADSNQSPRSISLTILF